jgi:hypothetical protein
MILPFTLLDGFWETAAWQSLAMNLLSLPEYSAATVDLQIELLDARGADCLGLRAWDMGQRIASGGADMRMRRA